MLDIPSVCAVVVTFNRKELLIEAIEALMHQTASVDAIYLIDNASSDQTPELLMDQGYISSLPPNVLTEPWEKKSSLKNNLSGKIVDLFYVRMDENTGGAGGFHEGIRRASLKSFDWLWVMDDDAIVKKDCLEKMLPSTQDELIVGIAPVVKRLDGSIDLGHRGIITDGCPFPRIQKEIALEKYAEPIVNIQTASFVGLMFRSDVVSKVGLPEAKFFIHNDDIEYCLRLQKEGGIVLVTNAEILHKEAAGPSYDMEPYQSLWLRYYGRRNLIYIVNEYSLSSSKFHFLVIQDAFKSVLKVLIKEDKKIGRIRFYIARLIDGYSKTFDNKKPKNILYKD